ncbi:phosphate regulon sensor histidine kinase PhoR [Thiohalobacter thiocyanaticus]|uniref:phosphate regulon sensor histidine kinase PhoR n=1 Tax=Thiohalobacter thiocyanaticus TaxID=585455 RepID=UPI000BBB63D9|nr:phosphate regulon sensor histidine kinase PhoR [Thiohalobacter thiocyanaticus]
MFNPWADEAWVVAALLVAALGTGLLLGQPVVLVLLLLLVVLAYLAWQLRNLRLLQRWLEEGRRFQPPESVGVWGDVFQGIYRLQQRNRKRKRKLRKMLKRFQEATEALPDATAVLTQDDEIEWWNPPAAGLLGLSYPRDIGQRIGNLIRHPDLSGYLRGGEYEGDAVELSSPVDEHIRLSLRIVPYGKNYRLLIARDITRLQQLEQMRRDFVANVSHELRTPLTVVCGYLETLEEECGRGEPELQKIIATMREQSERMQRIVDDLLMLSRLETERVSEQPEPVNVAAMLAQVCEDARRLSGPEHHQIRLEADAGLWLRGNDNELRSLFSNLVFNAVRYTPGGGEITVKWFCDDSDAVFEVADSGIGIAEHHLSRLTERFYRVDTGRSRARGGTGLGLAIVKHVLLRHGGRLEIDSRLDEGSTFRARLPAARVVRTGREPTGGSL